MIIDSRSVQKMAAGSVVASAASTVLAAFKHTEVSTVWNCVCGLLICIGCFLYVRYRTGRYPGFVEEQPSSQVIGVLAMICLAIGTLMIFEIIIVIVFGLVK